MVRIENILKASPSAMLKGKKNSMEHLVRQLDSLLLEQNTSLKYYILLNLCCNMNIKQYLYIL